MKMKETVVFVRMDWAEKACSKNIPNEDNHGIFAKMSHFSEATNDQKHLERLLKHKSRPVLVLFPGLFPVRSISNRTIVSHSRLDNSVGIAS